MIGFRYFRQFPLLTILLLVQIATLGIGAVAAMAVLLTANRAQNDAAIVRSREAMLPELAANHEKWRALKHLEMSAALEEVKEQFVKRFAAKVIDIVSRAEGRAFSKNGNLAFIYPESDDNTLDNVVYIQIDESRALREYGGTSVPIGFPLALVFSLVVSVFVSTYFIRKFFLLPMQLFAKRMAAQSDTEADSPATRIRAYGEMRVFFEQIGQLYRERRTAQQNAAIAQMTQMLAHDIRKPFSMFKATLDTIMVARSASELKLVTEDFIPEIDRAMNTVNGLLQDVLEVSSKACPHFEEARPESLIETTLVDLFSMQEKLQVRLDYHFTHSRMALVDVQKIMRVFINISNNAVQAMKSDGYLKFSTRDTYEAGKSYVEFSVFNSGSFIPGPDIAQLFEAFFTKNKRGGTGLGLAIAQKVIFAHGGRIACRSNKTESYPDGYVEFVFSVPAGGPSSLPDSKLLPRNSVEILSKVIALKSQTAHDRDTSIGLHQLEQSVIDILRSFGRQIRILVVDDEQVYKNAIRLHCSRNESLFDILAVEFVSGSGEGFLPDMDGAILDVDLGKNSLDGFEFAQELRTKFPEAFICVHSNRTFADDFKRSLQSGADGFLPKPMSYEHFLRFLAQLGSKLEKKPRASENPSVEGKALPQGLAFHANSDEQTSQGVLGLMAVVDDSQLVRTSWKLKVKDSTLECFESPEQFFSKLESDPGFSQRLSVVVTGFHFGTKSSLSGYEFALELKRRVKAPVLLFSDGEFSAEILSAFAAAIPKSVKTYAEIMEVLQKSPLRQ